MHFARYLYDLRDFGCISTIGLGGLRGLILDVKNLVFSLKFDLEEVVELVGMRRNSIS